MAISPTSSPVTSLGSQSLSASSVPQCRTEVATMPECRGAPKESKPARLNSRPITASCAKVPPAPPYSSGIAGQRSPAAPALFQTSRPYLPSSFQVSRCGTYSAAMKRRACSSSSTSSSVVQPGRGRLRTFMSNPVDRTAYRAPPHYARATTVDKRPPLFFSQRLGRVKRDEFPCNSPIRDRLGACCNLGARARHVDCHCRAGVASRGDSDRDDLGHFYCRDDGTDDTAVHERCRSSPAVSRS